MNLTTLGEIRIRGDLIETYKILTRKVDYAENVFKLGRSVSNIVSKINTNVRNDICRIELRTIGINYLLTLNFLEV